jgi:hypothetical protein
MHALESLVLVGPPRAGKDTLASGVDGPEFAPWADQVIRPQRWATRPPRSHDRESEWTHKSHEEFKQAMADGTISPWWTRSLDLYEEPEYYGFEAVDPEDQRLRIYSANWPILEKPDKPRIALLARAAIIEVRAHVPTLFQRLDEIGREMDPREREARRRKIQQRAPAVHWPGTAISTEDLKPEEGQELFRNFVKDVLKGWVPYGYTGETPQTELVSARPRPVLFDTDRL